ncbi:MAG: response regulator [Desulfobacterales bacterium]|nr:response regulator [Desulfobacterales bacterium]
MPDPSSKFEKLRQQAEELIQKQPDLSSEAPSDIVELIQELKIHQTELQIQNEELQRSQGELSELHREFENLYEFAPCGYLTLTAKGLITRANLTAVNLLETSRQFLSGAGFSQYIAEGWYDTYAIARKKCIETREKQSIEIPLKNKNEVPLWVRADIEGDFDETGVAMRWRMVLMDITAQRQTEEGQKRMEAIGMLAGGIAHDFSNILSSIIGYAQLGLDETKNDTSLAENYRFILGAGLRGKNLIKQIKTYSRSQNETSRPVLVIPIVKDILSFLKATLPANIEMRRHIKADRQVIKGNLAQMQQVLLNLCTNAAQAMRDNGGRLTLSVTNVTFTPSDPGLPAEITPGAYLKLSVADTGCGIPPDVQQKIFDRYYTTRDPNHGTGLGLSICHSIVRQNGGAISLDSSVGEGTTATVFFPVTGEDPLSEKDIPEASFAGLECILLVDDEKPIIHMGRRILEPLGYTVVTSLNGRDALEMFRRKPDQFGLVITDMIMPEMYGDELTHKLKEIRDDIPIILCSGKADQISENKIRDLGISAFLCKPYTNHHFIQTIRSVLDGW